MKFVESKNSLELPFCCRNNPHSAYYDKSYDSKELFAGLEIAEDPSFEKYLNQYDVIYLDITWFISTCREGKNIVDYLQEQVVKELQEAYPLTGKEETLPSMLSKIHETKAVLKNLLA